MSAASRLPTELLVAIFEDVLGQLSKDSETPAQSFFRSIQCCKCWYATGMPILFDTIVLQYPQLFSYQPLFFDSNHLLLARSLIVQATAVDFKSHRTLHRRLTCAKLDKTIPLRLASELTSFSLVYTSHQTHRNWQQSLTLGSVNSLLKYLPESVTSLDLDIPGVGVSIKPLRSRMDPRIMSLYEYDLPVQVASDHFCSTLTSMLRRLKSLRIRSSMICEDLFTALSQKYEPTDKESIHGHNHTLSQGCNSPLQTLIFRLDPWNWAHATRHCKDDSKRLLPRCTDSPPEELRALLVSAILALRENGALSQLKVCKIVEFENTMDSDTPSLYRFFCVLSQARYRADMRRRPDLAHVDQSTQFRILDVLHGKVNRVPYLDHARTTSDFGGGKRTWETQPIDWESRIDAEKTWRWI